MSRVRLNIPLGPAGLAVPPPPGQTKPVPEPSKTGKIPFTIPSTSQKVETWYCMYGELSESSIPLICLHGGPGAPHSYLRPCGHLATEQPYSRPVILYDQLGCGNSTLLPDKRGDTEFWTADLFVAELENLLSHFKITAYDLFGQSWGGMLASYYACSQPTTGLRRLILADSPASMITWVEVANELRKRLPQPVQEVLTRCEKEGKTDTEEYEKAVYVFYERFLCRVTPFPTELTEAFASTKKDDTVYNTMNGPSEFFVSGSLKTWDITSELHKINVPTLLINGAFDEAQDIVVQPFFREISGKVKWIRFAQSSHTPQLEETDAFVAALGQYLESDL